jgi:hypothetical protein
MMSDILPGLTSFGTSTLVLVDSTQQPPTTEIEVEIFPEISAHDAGDQIGIVSHIGINETHIQIGHIGAILCGIAAD